MQLLDHLDADRLGEPSRLVETRVGVAAGGAAEVRKGDDGAGTARIFRVAAVEAGGQAGCSSSCASMKLIGLSGCTVEIACL
jgi:uncharacterized metal-binding protein